jgi:hypothetical protein
MKPKNRLVLLLVCVLTGALLLGLSPVWAENYTLDGFTSGPIQGGLSGNTPLNPYVWHNGVKKYMKKVDKLEIISEQAREARTVNSSTLCIGEGNPWVNMGGYYEYVCDPVYLYYYGICY